MRRVFVTGTDTGVGKTLVSAVLARAWAADYWKPVQTGIAEEPGDSETVAALAGLAPYRIHPPVHVYPEPISPHAAAAIAGRVIRLDDFALPPGDGPLVVEGAGGVMVPLNDTDLMIDLIARLGLPVVVVARSTLGTINHTLLTLAALRARALPVLGVVLNGPPSPSNREAIAHHGQIPILAELPRLDAVTPAEVRRLALTLTAPPTNI